MAFLDNSGVTTLVTRLKTHFVLKTEIPTVPTPYTSNPAMDGTASAGTGTSYARGNHVHPHDTSKQDVLVSGTNIKTINGESILGSGDLTVGGGGGGDFFTAYSKHNDNYLYADSACTQRLIDAYEDDYAALWEDLKSADSVRIIEDDPSNTSNRYVFVASCINYDKVEPEIKIYYIRGVSIKTYNA